MFPYGIVDDILGETTITPSNTSRSEMMLMASGKLVSLYRGLHRIRLKIRPDNITWPKVDDRWTDMTRTMYQTVGCSDG